MKNLYFLILVVLLADAFCFLRKAKSSIQKNQNTLQTQQFEEYTTQLLSAINTYRQDNSYLPVIQYSAELEQTANQEASNLMSYESFGTHQNFGDLKNQILNEFLTEIILRISSDNGLPPVNDFCQEVIQAIVENNQKYLTYGYTQGAVALQLDSVNSKFIVVIHLIKPAVPKSYASCKDALLKGVKSDKILIPVNGTLKEVQCDQSTVGGGWTLVLDKNETLHSIITFPIDCMGIPYQEILFRAKDGYKFDSRQASPTQYKYDGFLFQANAFKFGTKWYFSEEYQADWYYDRLGIVVEKGFYKFADQIQVLQPSTTCSFEYVNDPKYCAKEFIFKAPLPAGGLNAISDVESINKSTVYNNEWKAYFQVYVR